MTITESKPEEAPAIAAAAPVDPALPSPPSGLAGIFGTADHKTVGRLYIGFSLLLGVGALVLALLIGIEGADMGSLDVLASDTFFQVFTLSHISLVFMAVLPGFLGLALYVVPLQLGAATVAFPRAAAASFWGWLVGRGLVVAAYLMNGGPAGGDLDGVLLSFTGWAVAIGALLVGTVCVVVTVATVRPPGMTLLRVPAFSWSMFVAGSLWLLNLTALLGNLVIVYVDTDHGQVLYGLPGNMWPQLSWIFAQPAVLSFAIPVLGIVGDIVPVMARRRQDRYPVTFGAIGAFGALSFGAYAQTVFNPKLVEEATYVVTSVVVVLPVLLLFAGWGDTIRRGKLRLSSAFLLAEISLLVLLGAVAAAAAYAIEPLNLTNTQWGPGVMKLVLSASIIAFAAGLFYWGGKVWGHRVAEPLGKLVALVLLGGAVLFGGADLISGAIGQLPPPPNGTPAVVEDGAEAMSLLSGIGAGLLAIGVVLVILAVLPAALRRGRRAPADPWDGFTLEWATASPPPFGNFVGPVAEVTSPTPLLDQREAAAATNGGA
jgi:heme/copper-type cytochrome/quinol oxidase subunit 1